MYNMYLHASPAWFMPGLRFFSQSLLGFMQDMNSSNSGKLFGFFFNVQSELTNDC